MRSIYSRPHQRSLVVRWLVDAVLSDLHGVVIQTAKLHEAAWKELFDSSLQQHAIQEHKSA
jgi:beta-phosphoglucomutase-like phosphatase (HAD superfamily)